MILQTCRLLRFNMDLFAASSECSSTEKRVKRTANWTAAEEEILVAEVEKRMAIIEGKWQRPGNKENGVTKSQKLAAWSAVMASINR